MTIEFRPNGDATTVVLEHSGLPSVESRERHGAGWRATFDNLAGRIFAEGEGG